MRLNVSLSQTEIESAFLSGTDTLQQRDLALRLVSLFSNLEHGTVSILDGRWGSGKTTFVRMWLSLLASKDFPTIYFDAFGYDYIASPYDAIASTFIKAAKEADRTTDPIYKNFLARAAKVGKAVAGASAKIGLKIATVGLIGAAEIDSLSELKDDIADALGDASDEAVAAALEKYAENEKSFQSLREALTLLPSLLSKSTGTARPLIVVIDELDRCRPDFALGVVETLKHFFRSDSIHFVLVTNKNHLALSVAHRYGVSTASNEYLEKFYDFVINFGHNYDKQDGEGIRAFIRRLREKLLSSNNYSHDIEGLVREIAIAYRLSLRQIEALFSAIVLAYAASSDSEDRPTAAIVFLCTLKILAPELYIKARDGTITHLNMKGFIESAAWGQGFNYTRMIDFFQYFLDPNIDLTDPMWREYNLGYNQFDMERTNTIKHLCQSVLDRFGDASLT